MKNICNHLPNLKPQKIANMIKKSSFKCNVSKHIDTQYNLCLHCGQTRCNGQNNCSKNHAQSSKHPLILKMKQCYVYCFVCDVEIQSMFDEIDMEGKGMTDKVERLRDLYEKIREMAIKNLPNIFTQKQKKYPEPTKQPSMSTQQQKKQKHHKEISQSSNIQLRTFGLSNIGNTCYFNSILQCLYSTIKIHEFYQRMSVKDDFNICFRKFLQNSQKVFSPKNIFSLLSKHYKFLKGMDQQDAFQLYVLLIDSLIESSAHPKQDNKSKIENSIGSIFGFNCASRLECLSCGKISWTSDFNLGLTVPLSRASNKVIDMPLGQEIDSQEIKEEGLFYPDKQGSNTFLDNFFSAQILSKPNSYKCQKCTQASATKKFYIKSPPQVLTINFKRFNNSGAKINTHISIPQQISLNAHCLRKGNYIYELYAGVVHSGSSRGGHYVAYTRRNNKWFHFSDSHVKPSSFNSMREANPYVIFYRRLDVEEDQQEQNQEKLDRNQKKQVKIKQKKEQENQDSEDGTR